MRDPETFEARLATAYRRYADEVTTDVDPMALARTITARPVRMPLTWSRLRPLRLALLLGLLVALALAGRGARRPSRRPRRPILTCSPRPARSWRHASSTRRRSSETGASSSSAGSMTAGRISPPPSCGIPPLASSRRPGHSDRHAPATVRRSFATEGSSS